MERSKLVAGELRGLKLNIPGATPRAKEWPTRPFTRKTYSTVAPFGPHIPATTNSPIPQDDFVRRDNNQSQNYRIVL
jgi:hypothetical protein